MVNNARDEGLSEGLAGYVELISRFTSGALSAPDFETRYLEFTKQDGMFYGEPMFGVIDKLFGDVDEYFDDPDATPEERAQAAETLRRQAKNALDKLRGLRADDAEAP